MKRILFFFTFIVCILCFASCENANVTRLKKEIEAIDKECPINMGIVGDLLSIKYDETIGEVQYYYMLNEEIMSIETLRQNDGLVSTTTKLSFSTGKARDVLNSMIRAGANLSITYKGSETGKTFKVSLPLERLKEMRDSRTSDYETYQLILDNTIAIENAQLPFQIDEYTVLDTVYDNGDKVIYQYTVDENLVDLSMLEYMMSDVKQGMSGIFEDPGIKESVKMVKALNKSIVFRYCGDRSDRSVDIEYTPNELSQYLR